MGGTNMTQAQAQVHDIGLAVIAEAQARFEACGVKDDFCVRATQHEGIQIFGKTNRVIFNPASGWKPDRCFYCTERFLREWDARYGK